MKRTSETGVHFYRDIDGARRGVRVDCSAHTIKLTLDGEHGADRSTLELGALRTALVTAMAFVGKALSVETYERDLSPVGDAIVGALQRCAGPLRDPALERALSEEQATPLVYSAPFLEGSGCGLTHFAFARAASPSAMPKTSSSSRSHRKPRSTSSRG